VRRCPQCGFSESELAGSIYLGCAVCYSVFSDLISPTIWSYQGSTVHHGEAPPAALPKPGRVEVYREAIEKARREGRETDVMILSDLLKLLEPESGE